LNLHKVIFSTFVPLKKVIAILVLTGFLSSTTEMHELFKLQHLVAHYFEHATTEKNATLAGFLHTHYSHDHNHRDDHHDKGCLPFQGDHSCQTIAITIINSSTSVEIKPDIPVHNLKQKEKRSAFIMSDFNSRIWQPPKTV
jgi:hypothetical protein